MSITKEQEQEFLKRANRGLQCSNAEFLQHWKSKPKFSSEDFLSFVNSTDEKCK